MQTTPMTAECSLPLAIATVPMQSFQRLYDAQTALSKGTVFRELDLPFGGSEVNRCGSCRR